MKVNRENLENCQAVLTIEAEAGELDESMDAAYRHLVKRVSIPGFRKGKAPRAILVQHIGRQSLLEEAYEHLVPELYRQAIESEELQPVARPDVEITQTEPLVFKAVVPLRPDVKLGDYHGMKLEPTPAVKIGKKEVTAALQEFRLGQGTWVPVDRPAKSGDLVTMDVEASVEDKPWLSRKDVVYEMDDDSRFPVPGFASQLQGAEKNQEMAFSLTIPEDYPIKDLCGKEASFKVTISETKERELPELDDELARSAGHDSLADMKKKVAADLKAQTEARRNSEQRQKALDALVDISGVSYPPVFEEEEIGGILKEEARRLGFTEVEEYLKVRNKTEEELKQEIGPVARKRLVQGLVLDKLAEEEKIEVDSSEVDNRVGEIAGGVEDQEKAEQFFSHPQIRQSIEHSLLTQKTLDRLLEVTAGNAEARAKEE